MLLYIIAIDVLANFINANKMIKRMQIGKNQMKLINFADGTIIFLWDITDFNMLQVILKLHENGKVTSSKSI